MERVAFNEYTLKKWRRIREGGSVTVNVARLHARTIAGVVTGKGYDQDGRPGIWYRLPGCTAEQWALLDSVKMPRAAHRGAS